MPTPLPPARRLPGDRSAPPRRLESSIRHLATLALLGAGELGLPSPAQAEQTQPDIILMVWDTTRADHLTPYGYRRNTTPNLDAIAKQGVVFERAYAVAPWTMPSVASMFTGLFTHNHQVDYGVQDWSLTLPSSATTLAEVMKEAGYVTHFYTQHAFHTHEQGYTQGFDHFDAGYPGTFAHRTKKALQAAGDQPAFILLYHLDPHSPYQPHEGHTQWADPDITLNIRGCGGERDLSKYPEGSIGWCEVHKGERDLTEAEFAHLEGLYDGELQHNDAWLGELWTMLEEQGERDNLAFFFTSDHGEGFNDHPRAKVWHLHGYDSNLHVPLIGWYPDKLKPRRVKTGVRTIDLFPTLADIAGAEVDHAINGESLMPLLTAEASDRPFTGTSHFDGAPAFYRDGRYKLMYSRKGKPWVELYDTVADPGEKNDLAPSRPDLVEKIKAKMKAFVTETTITLEDAGEKSRDDEAEMLKALGYTE